MKALAPELRSLVAARSLPDDVVLRNMRRALSVLGDEGTSSSLVEDSVGGDEPEPGSSSISVVTALGAVELRRETRLWMTMMYKNTSQHRRAVHFQRMRGVTRSLRALSALDVGSAAAALRDGLHAGVSTEAREHALTSPAVLAGAHALWKLPPRALWDDLSIRLRHVAEVASQADENMLDAAEALVGQLAHTFFMPFALVALAAIARLRASMHQLITDTVAVYNQLAPLLRGGIMPPPGIEPARGANGGGGDAAQPPEALVCEWRSVSVSQREAVPPSQITLTRKTLTVQGRWYGIANAQAKAMKPHVREVQMTSVEDANAIGDEDWGWRVLRRSADPTERRGTIDGDNDTSSGAKPKQAEPRKGDTTSTGGEDIGASVPRRVRGVDTIVDKGGANGTLTRDNKNEPHSGPSYQRATFVSGLGMAAKPPAPAVAKNNETKSPAPVEKNNERKSSDATPSFDFASLAKGLAAPVVTSDQGDAVNTKQPGSGGKKRRRPKKDAAETTVVEEKSLTKKPKKPNPNSEQTKPNPKSAVERAMALLFGE